MGRTPSAWLVALLATTAGLGISSTARSEGGSRCSGRVEIRESLQLTASRSLAPGRELVVLKSGAELRSSLSRVEIIAPCDLVIEERAAILADSEVVLRVAGKLELSGAIVAGDEQGQTPGRVEIQAQSLHLAPAALIRATGNPRGASAARGGRIWIDVLDSDLEVPAGVLVSADAGESSTAGHITISASGDVVLEGTLSASNTSLSGQGKGGGVLLESRDGALTIGEAGEVQAVGNDRGGEVALMARTSEHIRGQVLALDRSGAGSGGSIEVVAGGHLSVGGEMDVGGRTRDDGAISLTYCSLEADLGSFSTEPERNEVCGERTALPCEPLTRSTPPATRPEPGTSVAPNKLIAGERRPEPEPDRDEITVVRGTADRGDQTVEIVRPSTAQDCEDRRTDTDQDGLSDAYERLYGTSPTDPDTDGDGLPDGGEWDCGADPRAPDSDADGIPDGAEVTDTNRNGVFCEPSEDGWDLDGDRVPNSSEAGEKARQDLFEHFPKAWVVSLKVDGETHVFMMLASRTASDMERSWIHPGCVLTPIKLDKEPDPVLDSIAMFIYPVPSGKHLVARLMSRSELARGPIEAVMTPPYPVPGYCLRQMAASD